MQRSPAAPSLQQLPIGPKDLPRFLRGFLQKFDAKIPKPGRVKFLEKRCARLCMGLEQRIAAAHIGPQGMLNAHAVAQMNPMLFAGPPAIRVVGAV